MPFTIAAMIQWVGLARQVFAVGSGLWTDIKRVLADHGVAADTAELDAVAADADRRKALAEAEARG
jgi:hypothetical protein